MKRSMQLAVEPSVSVRDHMDLKSALQRRGIAMHIANLLSFKTHETLIKLYFDELNREELPDHFPTTIHQVRATDKEVFIRLADQTRRGFSALGDLFSAPPIMPLDKLVTDVLNHPRVVSLLLPLAKPHQSRNNSQNEKKRGSEEVDRLRAELKRQKQAFSDAKKNKGGGKGKGDQKKGKGNNLGREKNVRIPKGLLGMSTSWQGKPLCYAYNLDGCQHKGVDRCSKGEHLCAFPGCGQQHGLQSCPKKVST